MSFDDIILKCILQVRKECKFFAALMMFSKIIPAKVIDTAATDGKDIFVNEDFIQSLNSSQQNALLLHEVLHVALLHIVRLGNRDQYTWNIAADIVVNDLIKRNTSFDLPTGAILEPQYQDMSVEEIYEKLLDPMKQKEIQAFNLMQDLMPEKSNGLKDYEKDKISSYWQEKIEVIKRDISENQNDSNNNVQGCIPLGMEREIICILDPEIDWKIALWKYVSKTPSDFDDLDRRFVYRGLYLEGLLTDSLSVSVCIDTSGSISSKLLEQFTAELIGIIRCYPHVKVDLYYADADLYGPVELINTTKIPQPQGFGGTSFKPFFHSLEKNNNFLNSSPKLSVYLTDGYGDFPEQEPHDPILWVVPRDGLKSSEFPYGEVIRISTEN